MDGFTIIDKFDKVGNFIGDLNECDWIGFDTESSDLDYFTATFLLAQFYLNGRVYILDVQRLKTSEPRLLNYIFALVADSQKTVVGHNLKYDLNVVRANHGEVFKIVHDTMITESVLYLGVGKAFYSLKELAKKYAGVDLDKGVRNQFIGATSVTQEMLLYAADDVVILGTIRDAQLAEAQERNLVRVVNLENWLVPATAAMEFNGVTIDTEKWTRLAEEAAQSAAEYETRVFDGILQDILQKVKRIKEVNALKVCEYLDIPVTAKRDQKYLSGITEISFIEGYIRDHLNLGSPKQLLTVLTKIYQIPVPDTNRKTLEKFEESFPILKEIAGYKEASKKASSFGLNFLALIHPKTGRLHTTFNQTGTTTGRYSSSNANLQNIPRDSSYRECFTAPPGKKIVGFDFSQQELRMLAKLCQDEKLVSAFQGGVDVHLVTAAGLFDVPLEEVTKEQRQKGKNVNFGVVYGISEYGLYQQFQIPREEGRVYLDKFFNEIYTTLRDFHEVAVDKILEMGYSVTPFGRKRYFERKSMYTDAKEYRSETGHIGRAGFNLMVQGWAADCTKICIGKMFHENTWGDRFKLILTVHDEVVAEVDEEIAEEAYAFMLNIMESVEQAFLEEIPALAEGYIADHWSK